MSPGVNPACTLRASTIAQEIKLSVDTNGTRIRERASDVTDGLQPWFSPRKWNQLGDDVQDLKSNIFASILKLEDTMSQIHSCRVKPSARRWR